MTTQTRTIDDHRSLLQRHLERGDAYSFLDAVEPYLHVVHDDPRMRLLAVREYLKLSLIQPGKDLLQPIVGESLPPELAALATSLAGLPGGVIPWGERAPRLEKNLAVLRARGIDTALISTAWDRNHDRFQLFRDAHRVDQVRMRDDGGWRWIPFLGHHPKIDAARPLPEGVNSRMPAPVLFDGLGHGGFFERVWRATRDTFLGYSCALFIAEPDPALFAVTLHLHDWAELLSDQRVFIFLGESMAETMRAAFDANADLPWPAQVVSLAPHRTPSAIEPASVITDLYRKHEARVEDSWRRIQRQYADRDARFWSDRFRRALSGQDQPLRILAAVSTRTTFLQYSMRDALRAFEELGFECELLIEKTPFDIISPLSFHEAIRRLDPDVYFNIDHLRHEFTGIIPDGLPILTWDQDQLPHVFTADNVKHIGPLDFLAGTTKSHFTRIGGRADQFLACHMPTAFDRFADEPMSDEERRRFECDVSYVSHASQTPRAFHDEERALYVDPRLRRLLDLLFEQLPAMLRAYRVPGGLVVTTLLRECCERCGIDRLDPALRDRLLWWYLWRLGDRLFRHEALEWVASWARKTGRTLRIYGNGWDKHPTLAEFAAGPAANGRELACIHRASRINLQLMPAGFIHQRALDGLACGGFFLTRLVPHDLRSRTLRDLVRTLQDRHLRTADALLASTDPHLDGLMTAYYGEHWRRMFPREDAFVDNLFHAVELPGPDEVYPDFAEITFDSPEAWSTRADAFLADPARRASIAETMRRVTLERFSYRRTMERFLHAMSQHLDRAADDARTNSPDASASVDCREASARDGCAGTAR